MYLEHFGLEQAPFRITPDTRVFYSGGDRGAVLEALAWAVESGEGIVKVVGEVGSGKTMLARTRYVRRAANDLRPAPMASAFVRRSGAVGACIGLGLAALMAVWLLFAPAVPA